MANGRGDMFGRSRAFESPIMTKDDQKNLRHTKAMSNILGMMIEFEDRNCVRRTY